MKPMGPFSTVTLSDYSILSSQLNDLKFDSKCIINTVNQYSYVIAELDEEFKDALSQSTILLPDGVGIVAAVKLMNNQNIKKIAGADMHDHLLKKLNAENGSCFYMGSSEKTLALIKNKINTDFPNIRAGFYSPPFKAVFSKEDNEKIIRIVNDFKPDVLFVGMTAPKQEKWTHMYKDALNVPTICTIGAVFDFYAGTVNRPSELWRGLGLEWFVRLLKEPKRMAKRYLFYGPVFIMMLLKKKIGQFIFRGPVVLQ
jgi:N-acetylglucosaminyldiphosphoundecaprenol N-acetyl-beta-D-mannosaminyltransferase